MLYIDLATLWVAPMNLNVDEDVLVRILRYAQDVRAALTSSHSGTHNQLHQEILALQHQGTKSWGDLAPLEISSAYASLMSAGKAPYQTFRPLARTQFLFFSRLQLHPLDILLCTHSTPELAVTAVEMSIIALISQLDGVRLCLNALIVEHALGTSSIIMDVIAKHYKRSLWGQVHYKYF